MVNEKIMPGFRMNLGTVNNLIATFLAGFGSISGSFGLAMGILAQSNSPDMPLKRTKKVRLGIKITKMVMVAVMNMMLTVMSLGEQKLTFCTKKPLTLFSTILCAHFSKLSSSPDILLTGLAPEAFDKEDLPSRVFTESGRLNPVVPT